MSYFLHNLFTFQTKNYLSECCGLRFRGLDTKATRKLAQQLWKWNPFETLEVGNCEIWTWGHSVDWSGSWTLCLQASAVISGTYAITLKCFDRIARCVAQLHLGPAAFSVQPEIASAVGSWRVCSQGDFASRKRGLGVNTQRRSGRLPPIIRQPFHRALWHVFFFFFFFLLRGFPLETVQVCQSSRV